MMVMFSGKLVMMMMRLVQSVTAKDENWEEVGKLHTAADLGGNPLTAVLRPPSHHLLLLLFLLLPLLLLFLLSSPPPASCCSHPGARPASSLMEGEVNPHTSLAASFYKKQN